MQLLGHWAIELLIHRPKELQSSPSGHRLKPSSVRRYIQAIGAHLVSEAGDLVPLGVDGDEIQVIYDAMLGNIPSASERAYAGRVLSYFHEYLRQVWKVAAVDLEGFTGTAGPKELDVDANIIDEHIVNVAIETLQASGHDNRLRKIWILILLLGYGCGLRRREALCLRMQDIHWDFSSELLIRRSVKTNDSMRRVPLDLLRRDLEELLNEWYQMRLKECGGKLDPQALLFCQYENPYDLLAEQVVFNPIESALRVVTGDATLRFHHLRHSFATWMIFRHIGSRFDSMPYPFFEYGFYGDQCRELHHLTGHGGSSMKVLYMVAQLCGHASPSTTLLH
jgi:integrase